MNAVSKETLASIEASLVNDATSTREALFAAYRLGLIDGRLEMAGTSEAKLREILLKAQELTKTPS